jgi:uncharacterized membrane protein
VSGARSRLPVAALFLFTGLAHLSFARGAMERIVPPWVPGTPRAINQIAGVAELAGGVLALVPGAERPARRYLTVLLLAVFPANVQMAVRRRDIDVVRGVPPWLLWARLPLQFVAIGWVGRVLRDRDRVQ